MLRTMILAVCATALLLTPAQARHRHVKQADPFGWAFNGLTAATGEVIERAGRVTKAVFLPHPAGCPARAFCGCGAARELGLHDRSLWLASSWYRFPRSAPGHNTVAVRPHHVFVLKQQVRGSIWLVADYNSGGHQSRLHERDISRYTIVSPR